MIFIYCYAVSRPKKVSPYIVHIIFYFWSFEINGDIQRI